MKLFRRKLWIFRPFYKLYYLDNNYYLVVTSDKDYEAFYKKHVDDYFEKLETDKFKKIKKGRSFWEPMSPRYRK